MAVIHLIGPNAIGKTTAVRRWGMRYQQPRPISFDLLRKPGYNTLEEKVERCLEYRAAEEITVVESARTTQLACISCDNGGSGEELVNGVWVKAKGDWKGDKENRKALLDDLRNKSPIALVESARTTTTTYALPTDSVIIVVCPGAVLGKHLEARCAAKGKKFRAEYWTPDKLEYESSRRYLNFVKKNLSPNQYKVFHIADQATDWEAVDEYFGSVYRRLHNELVRKLKERK